MDQLTSLGAVIIHVPIMGHHLGSARTTHLPPFLALQHRIEPKHLIMTQHPPRVRAGYEETPLLALMDYHSKLLESFRLEKLFNIILPNP